VPPEFLRSVTCSMEQMSLCTKLAARVCHGPRSFMLPLEDMLPLLFAVEVLLVQVFLDVALDHVSHGLTRVGCVVEHHLIHHRKGEASF
jgi:hypothetical protein